jgi:hypothetical protein
MSVTIRRGFLAVVSEKGWGDKEIFAPTLEQLDREVEAYFARLLAVKESRTKAMLERIAGRQRQLYRDARAQICGSEQNATRDG